jgi:heme-degrading monooxygenase HmoA
LFISMNRLQCPETYAEHLERAFKHAGNLESVPGFVLFQFLKQANDDGTLLYVALTQWESREAFEAWLKSESFKSAHSGPGASGASPVTSTTEAFEVLT